MSMAHCGISRLKLMSCQLLLLLLNALFFQYAAFQISERKSVVASRGFFHPRNVMVLSCWPVYALAALGLGAHLWSTQVCLGVCWE